MKDGSILLWRSSGFIGWCIKRVTGMPWGHAATYISGMVWEFTVWWAGYWWRSGVRVTEWPVDFDEMWRTRRDMTESELYLEQQWWLRKLDCRTPYNVPKLLLDAIVYPCRRFFKRLGWIPFDNPVWGEVCSSGVDEAKRAAGIDLLPGHMEGATAPGDLRNSSLLIQVINYGEV